MMFPLTPMVVQLRSQTTGDPLAGMSVQEIGELVANLTTRNNQLREEIATLESQRESVQAAVQRGDTSAVGIRSDLARILAELEQRHTVGSAAQKPRVTLRATCGRGGLRAKLCARIFAAGRW